MSRPKRGARRLKASKQVSAVASRCVSEPQIEVVGQLDRVSHLAFQTAFYLPEDVRERIEARLTGPFSSSLIGLLVYALDEMDRQHVNLTIQMDTVTSLPE